MIVTKKKAMVEEIFVVIFLSVLKDVIAGMEGFIVGGQKALITNHAHSAFLSIECNADDGRYLYCCGASIVNQLILLTAAHCLEECRRSTRITINAGHANRKKGQKILGKSFMVHEKYNIREISNDLALVRLKTGLEFGKTVRRVVLMRDPPYHERGSLAGWGFTDDMGEQNTFYLKKVNNLQVWSRASCSQSLMSMIPKGAFCAGFRKGKEYAAGGDSGSALVVRDIIQIGLVSFKFPKISKSLVIYTDIGYHYDWIATNAKKLYCKNK